MKFIWYTTELNNRNHWGGTFVGYHQSSALKKLGHAVQLLDPASDFSFYVNEIKPDWVYVPVEFTQYPCFQNIPGLFCDAPGLRGFVYPPNPQL